MIVLKYFNSYHRAYSKHSKRWTVTETMNAKKYDYLPKLMESIIKLKLEDRSKLHRRATLSEGDPRLLSPTTAPIPPPDTQELVRERRSRFESQQN